MMLTLEQLARYDNDANFRIIVKESPALATELHTLPFPMFVVRKLHDNHWCIYGMTMADLDRICGANASFNTMVITTSEVGTKIIIDEYIVDLMLPDYEAFKNYDYSDPNEFNDAMNWWHSINFEEKFIQTIKWLKQNNLNATLHHPHNLSDSQIKEIYNNKTD